MKGQQRSSGRVNLDKVVGKCRFLNLESEWENCEITDISLGGISITGEKSFFIGDAIEVSFFLDAQAIFAQVEITNVQGKNCGARFTTIHKKEEAYIHKYINKHLLRKGK